MPEDDDFAAGFAALPPAAANDRPAEPTAPVEAKPAEQPPADQPAAEVKAEPPAIDEAAKLKAEIADALHRERSSANRVSAFQKENDALKRRLAELEAAEAARKKAPEAPADDSDLDDVLTGAPDLKAAVEARLKRATEPLLRQLEEVTGRLKEVDERASKAVADVQPLRQRSEQAEAQQVAAALHEQFPGWTNEVREPRFQRWLGEQSAEIRALYENGTTVQQAGTVLRLYRADTGALAKPAAAPAAADKTTDATARLRAATGIPSRPNTAKVDDRDDFSAGFRMAVK